MEIEKSVVIDLLDNQQDSPALSSTDDMPVVETKPDSQNAPPAAAPEPKEAEDAKQPEDSATSATDEPTAEPAKKESRGVQKALDRLTAEREAEKRRADQETEARIRLEERLRLLEEQRPVKPVDEAPVPPTRGDYSDPDAWDAAMLAYAGELSSYTVRKEVAAAEAKARKDAEAKEIEDGQRAAREAFAQRASKIAEKYADFKEVTENSTVEISMPVVHAIVHSERGPELQYHLAKNPDEAKRISALSPPLQLLELGLILAKIDQPASKPVSAAPRPINPTRAGTEAVRKDPNDMSMDEYAAYYREREGLGRARH